MRHFHVQIGIVLCALLFASVHADAQLEPTPTGGQARPGANSSSSGLDVPDHWSTLENGMLIPNPVTMNGRVLMTAAISYYSKWKGLPDPIGAGKALSDYLLLAALSQNPQLIESNPSTYALLFLSESERGKYACNPSEERKKLGRNEPNVYRACQPAHTHASMLSLGPNLNFWLGATEVERRHSRQAFLDDYRDRFLAAAPNLPIELLDFRYISVSTPWYKGGFRVEYTLPGSHLLYRSLSHQIWFSYETDVERDKSRIGPGFSEFWPIELAEGQVIVHRFGSNVPIQHYMTLTELKNAPKTFYFDAKLRLNSVVAYEDPLLEQELYRFKGFADKIIAKKIKAKRPDREGIKTGTQTPRLAQEPHPFGGFTVMEIGNDYIHKAVGMGPGFRGGKATVLMTLIAGNRSYASIAKGSYDLDLKLTNITSIQDNPHRVTWIRQEEGTPNQIVMGDGDGWVFSMPGAAFRISNEFRLQRLGPKQALFIKDDLRVVLPIVANYPVLSIDWSDPLLSRFRINGYGLGSVTKNDIAKMYPRMNLAQKARQLPKMGRLKRIETRSEADSGRVIVSALADVDRLISEGQAEIVWLTYSQQTQIPFSRPGKATNLGSTETFYETMSVRYGEPSAVIEIPLYLGGPIWVWAHDLYGRFLSEEEDSNDPCLKHVINLVTHNGVSPSRRTVVNTLGCGLVMVLSNVQSRRGNPQDPSTSRVVEYRIQLFHGHAIAHHFYSDRMYKVEAAQKSIPNRAEQPPDNVPSPQRHAPSRRGRRGGGR